MAVAAQAGSAKSTKQNIRGSPPRCIRFKTIEEEKLHPQNPAVKNTKHTERGSQLTCLDSLFTSLTSLYPTNGRNISISGLRKSLKANEKRVETIYGSKKTKRLVKFPTI